MRQPNSLQPSLARQYSRIVAPASGFTPVGQRTSPTVALTRASAPDMDAAQRAQQLLRSIQQVRVPAFSQQEDGVQVWVRSAYVN